MVDIHHHLLPEIDDGAKDLETSVAMARMALEEGITHVICTPHANGQYDFDSTKNARKLAELQARLALENIPLILGLGCDFHLSFDNVAQALKEPRRFSINENGYLLVEIPDYGIPPGITETLYELQLAGLVPILTHPERNPTLQNEPHRLAEWLRGGVLVQVTADSITGHKGRRAQRMSHELLDKRWVHILATDAHNTTSRPPRMKEAYDTVASKYGSAYAYSICLSNPLAVFLGESFEAEEEPHGLYEESARPTWWQRLIEGFTRR